MGRKIDLGQDIPEHAKSVQMGLDKSSGEDNTVVFKPSPEGEIDLSGWAETIRQDITEEIDNDFLSLASDLRPLDPVRENPVRGISSSDRTNKNVFYNEYIVGKFDPPPRKTPDILDLRLIIDKLIDYHEDKRPRIKDWPLIEYLKLNCTIKIDLGIPRHAFYIRNRISPRDILVVPDKMNQSYQDISCNWIIVGLLDRPKSDLWNNIKNCRCDMVYVDNYSMMSERDVTNIYECLARHDRQTFVFLG
jgi:hypothetical protein